MIPKEEAQVQGRLLQIRGRHTLIQRLLLRQLLRKPVPHPALRSHWLRLGPRASPLQRENAVFPGRVLFYLTYDTTALRTDSSGQTRPSPPSPVATDTPRPRFPCGWALASSSPGKEGGGGQKGVGDWTVIQPLTEGRFSHLKNKGEVTKKEAEQASVRKRHTY